MLLIRTLCLIPLIPFSSVFFHLIHWYGSSDLDVLRLTFCTLLGSQIGITRFSLTCISILVGHLASVLLVLKLFSFAVAIFVVLHLTASVFDALWLCQSL